VAVWSAGTLPRVAQPLAVEVVKGVWETACRTQIALLLHRTYDTESGDLGLFVAETLNRGGRARHRRM
jgi:hypothetical protein